MKYSVLLRTSTRFILSHRFKRYFVRSEQLLEIMLKQLTPEKVINIIWFSVASSLCWPLSTYSSRTRILIYKVLQIISVINACMLILTLLYSVYVHSDDIIIVFESICLILGVSQLMIQTIICSVNSKSLQVSSYSLLQFLSIWRYTYLKIRFESRYHAPLLVSLIIITLFRLYVKPAFRKTNLTHCESRSLKMNLDSISVFNVY